MGVRSEKMPAAIHIHNTRFQKFKIIQAEAVVEVRGYQQPLAGIQSDSSTGTEIEMRGHQSTGAGKFIEVSRKLPVVICGVIFYSP